MNLAVNPSDTMSPLEFAGMSAAQVEAHWHKPEYRNLIALALGTYIENMIVAHQGEWTDLVNRASRRQADKARRSVVKAYLSTVSKDLTDEKGHLHDTRGRFESRGGHTQALHDLPGQRLDIDQAARLGHTINAFGHYSTEDKTLHNQQMKFTVEDKKGNQRTFVSHDGKLPDLAKDEKVVSYKPLGLAQTQTVGGHTFNLLQALGAPSRGAAAGGGTADTIQAMAKSNGNHYEKVRAASELMTKLAAAGVVPAPLAAAGMVGMYAAKHGPEVVEVLGPHMRRFSYKYRGMEALPAQKSMVAGKGMQPGEGPEQFEVRLAHALASTDKSKGGVGAIPTEEQNRLLLKTGGTAPSQGFILDKKGEVKQQAVGASDDHYVPFNLKHLHDLDGGSYVRSRAYGGPTTEDMALALRTGAKRINVVSRHGLYTVEFEHRANSIRGRYGDVPPLVINRYGRLLDGIKNGNLTDPATGQGLKLNGHGYEVALKALQAQFPLLIKDVKYEPHQSGLEHGEHPASDREDSGYVRPHYLKPSEAVNGYYDDLLGSTPKSYDELKGYRTAKANRYRAARDVAAAEAAAARRRQDAEDAARRARPTFGNTQRDANQAGVRDGQSPIPSNLTAAERTIAEAGGGTSSSESAQSHRKVSVEHGAALLNYGQQILAEADPADQEAARYRDMFVADDSSAKGLDYNHDHLSQYDALASSLMNSPEARQSYMSDLADIWDRGKPSMDMPPPPGGNFDGDEEPQVDEAHPDADKQLIGEQDAKEYDLLKRYTALMKNHVDLQKQGKALKPENQKTLEGLHAFFSSPDPDFDPEEGEPNTRLHAWTGRQYDHLGGLTYQEHIENQIDRQEGRKPRHAERAPVATVSEDDSDDDKERIADEYMKREMADLMREQSEADDPDNYSL